MDTVPLEFIEDATNQFSIAGDTFGNLLELDPSWSYVVERRAKKARAVITVVIENENAFYFSNVDLSTFDSRKHELKEFTLTTKLIHHVEPLTKYALKTILAILKCQKPCLHWVYCLGAESFEKFAEIVNSLMNAVQGTESLCIRKSVSSTRFLKSVRYIQCNFFAPASPKDCLPLALIDLISSGHPVSIRSFVHYENEDLLEGFANAMNRRQGKQREIQFEDLKSGYKWTKGRICAMNDGDYLFKLTSYCGNAF